MSPLKKEHRFFCEFFMFYTTSQSRFSKFFSELLRNFGWQVLFTFSNVFFNYKHPALNKHTYYSTDLYVFLFVFFLSQFLKKKKSFSGLCSLQQVGEDEALSVHITFVDKRRTAEEKSFIFYIMIQLICRIFPKEDLHFV